MIKFEDKYVHFRWSDELKGKRCFAADTLENLELLFEQGKPIIMRREHSKAYPFESEKSWHQFCYYDPHYDLKVAFNEGKQIQFKLNDGHWRDIQGEPAWSENTEYRIKPAGLQWTDLKVGDIIHNSADHLMLMVIGIDENAHQTHICAGHSWITDCDLADNWKKV